MRKMNRFIVLIIVLFISIPTFCQQQQQVEFFRDGQKLLTIPVSDIDSIVSVISTNPDIPDNPDKPEIPEYVDLGLSVKWGTCNVGANKPEEYGDYFAWGETRVKNYYYWSTYLDNPSCDGLTFSKYYIDGKTILAPENDAAYVCKGENWRMPTIDEQLELVNPDNCLWIWFESGNTEFNGVSGYKVSGKKAGFENNFIFLPAAGYISYSNSGDVGIVGYYWSSSLDSNESNKANYMVFSSYGPSTYGYYRDCGRSVRPVFATNPDKPNNSECLGKPAKLEIIDLGLSVNWANLNYGAESPEQQGSYIAWGEISSKDTYNWSTHKYSKDSEYTLTKYCADEIHGFEGFIDNKTTLDAEDDPARSCWGENWRVPTIAEFEELFNYCTWSWTTENDVEGYTIRSNIEGYTDKSIFLPVTGVIGENGMEYPYYGNYWTNSTANSVNGVFLDFGQWWHNLNYSWGRYAGRCFRPVWEK